MGGSDDVGHKDKPKSRSRGIPKSNRLQNGTFKLRTGDYLCEPALYCEWEHCGDFTSTVVSTVMELCVLEFAEAVRYYPYMTPWAAAHAARCIYQLNESELSDRF